MNLPVPLHCTLNSFKASLRMSSQVKEPDVVVLIGLGPKLVGECQFRSLCRPQRGLCEGRNL